MIGVPKPPVHAKDAGFIAWLHTQPCIACGALEPTGFNRIEAAHLESCRYGDAENAVSLCGSKHHRDGATSLHQMGREPFEAFWHVSLHAEAVRLWEQYQAE